MQNYIQGYALRAGLIAGLIGIVVVLFSLIPMIGCFIGLCAWLVYLGAGVLAARGGKSEGTALTLQQSGIDGALAGGIAGLISQIVKWIADIIVVAFFRAAFLSNLGTPARGLIESLVIGFVVMVFGIIFATLLGAGGGLIYTAIQQSQKKT